MTTPDQLKALQQRGIDWLGQPLQVDGNLGPKTEWFAYLESLDRRREMIVRTALKYFAQGVRETPGQPNRGPVVDLFQAPTGMALGFPWCLSFVSYVMTEAGADWPVYHASAAAAMAWAAKERRIVKNPLPGDVFTFLYPPESKLAGHGHGGIVLGYDGTWIADCDGNVGDSVRVGFRAAAGLSFIRTLKSEVAPVMPQGLVRLDGHGTT
jgi:CHAP domain-containing protein